MAAAANAKAATTPVAAATATMTTIGGSSRSSGSGSGNSNALLKQLYHERMSRTAMRRRVLHVPSGTFFTTPTAGATADASAISTADSKASPAAAVAAADSGRDAAACVVVVERVGQEIGSIAWTDGVVACCQFLRAAVARGFTGRRAAAAAAAAAAVASAPSGVDGTTAVSSRLTVVELGAGVGTCGLYAARLFASATTALPEYSRRACVVVTDRSLLLPLLRANAAANPLPASTANGSGRGGAVVRVAELSWGDTLAHVRDALAMPATAAAAGPVVAGVPTVAAAAAKSNAAHHNSASQAAVADADAVAVADAALPCAVDLVLASDVVYQPDTFVSLLTSLQALCTAHATLVLLSYRRRSAAERAFFHGATAAGFRVLHVHAYAPAASTTTVTATVPVAAGAAATPSVPKAEWWQPATPAWALATPIAVWDTLSASRAGQQFVLVLVLAVHAPAHSIP